MTCEEARGYFVDVWRGDMDETAERAFQTHLHSCETCRREVESLRSVWEGLGAVPRPEPDAGLRTDFYSSLREWQRRDSERKRPLWWVRHPAVQGIAAAVILAACTGPAVRSVAASNDSAIAQPRRRFISSLQLLIRHLHHIPAPEKRAAATGCGPGGRYTKLIKDCRGYRW